MIVVTFFVGVLVGLILSVLLERREDVNPSNLGRLNRLRGLYRKYTKFTFLPKDSKSSKRFNDAIKKARDAKTVFIRDCECKYKKKV